MTVTAFDHPPKSRSTRADRSFNGHVLAATTPTHDGSLSAALFGVLSFLYGILDGDGIT